MSPKISVVIPTYNRAGKVQKSIESVLAQTLPDLEVIVADDGSSDGTEKALSQSYGNRIRYFFQPNQGVSAARNLGIQMAQGNWIAFLDSDDLWEKDKLEWQFKALERFSPHCGACYTDTRLFNNSETRTLFQMAEGDYRHEEPMGVNTDVLRLLVRPGGAGMVIHLSSLVVRADVLKKTGGFNRELGYGEDSELMFRLGMQTNFCYVNQPLVQFDRSPVESRHVGVSSDWNRTDFLLQASQRRLEGLLAFGDKLPTRIREVIRERLSTVYSGWANWYLENGKYKEARSAASKAAKLNPTLNFATKLLLTWISPRLALQTVRYRQQRIKDSFTV